MDTLKQLASRYRWELMLLVGIPVIIYMSRWVLIKILANFNLSLADWFCRPYFSCGPDYVPSFFSIWLPLLLGFLYYFMSAAYDGIPCLCFGPMRLFSLHTGQPVRCFWKGWILNGGSELRGRGGTKARRSYI